MAFPVFLEYETIMKENLFSMKVAEMKEKLDKVYQSVGEMSLAKSQSVLLRGPAEIYYARFAQK